MTIHQEVTIDADPAAVFRVLTTSDMFEKMSGGRAAKVAADVGGVSSMFGGDIQAVNVEVVKGQRLVQAWRSKAWPAGVYSLVTFALAPSGKRTRITFDQIGYPDGAHDMLDGGWHQMYWNPMNVMLASA